MLDRMRRYRVIDVLGRGAVGTVYRAEFLGEGGFRRQVALKRLRADARGADAASRLRDEARLLARVRHRALVNVDDLVLLEGHWTVVMDYVDGVDLLRVLREHGRIPPTPAVELVRDVAAGLATAWSWPDDGGRPLHLLHRDLKPSNILLSAAGEPTVVDFGVARFDDEHTRETQSNGAMLGSVGYVAPERLDGTELPAGDVYSLGVVLAELLTGASFGRALDRAQHAAAVERAAERLTHHAVPPLVIALVREMVAFDPATRPDARQVERQCSKLARELGGPDLHDWAEQQVPRLQARVRADLRDDLVGRILIEASATTVPAQMPISALPTFDALTDEQSHELREGLDPPEPTDTGTLPAGSWAARAIHSPEDPTPAAPALVDGSRRLKLALAAAILGAGVLGTAALVLSAAILWLLTRAP